MKQSHEELEEQLNRSRRLCDAALANERVWETAMMQACGEDGPKSVADKFAALEAKCSALAAELKQSQIDAGCYKHGMEASNSRLAQVATENAALKFDVPMGAIENGRVFADRLEAYPFECEGGDLNMCSDWQEFRRCFDHLSEWAMHSRSETPSTDAFLAEVRAQGAEECVRQLVISDDDDFSDAPNICAMVAHQLRQEVAQ